MQRNFKVSIIVPIYNAENTLPRCVNSVLAQTYSNWELILVDDGSQDSCAIICDGYAKNVNRIIVKHKTNGRVGSARNVGLSIVSGDVVVFLDADDELTKDAIETVCKNMDDDVDMLASELIRIPSVSNEVNLESRFFSAEEYATCLLSNYQGRYQGYIGGKVFRKSIIDSTSNLRFDEKIFFNEDRLFITEYICNSKRIKYIDDRFYKYYYSDSSAMASVERDFNPLFVTDLHAFSKMLRCYRQHGFSESVIRANYIGIIESRDNIADMMKRFGVNDVAINSAINAVVKKDVPLSFRLNYYLKKHGFASFHQVKRKINRLIGYGK